MPTPRATIDASKLPDMGWDAHAPLWWGNLLLIFVETTSMALLFAAYFYIRRQYWEWPPPRVDVMPVIGHPVPALTAGTLNALLMLAACLPMYWTNQAARRRERSKVAMGIGFMLVVTIIASLLRWREFDDVHFRWNDNAYASAVWTILGLHFIYILTALVEFLLVGAWLITNEMEEKHGMDVTLIGGFWYWLAGIGLVQYVIVYWYPRWS